MIAHSLLHLLKQNKLSSKDILVLLLEKVIQGGLSNQQLSQWRDWHPQCFLSNIL